MAIPYVLRWIAEGEHQQQDFKMRIDDARKIARTLVAFANTDGGRLLVGVRDNGQVAGVRAEEEMHMLESASALYCQPPVRFSVQAWKVEHRTVLEVLVEPSPARPHRTETEPGQWKAFIRRDDQNLPAPAVLLEVWRHRETALPLRYTHTEREQRVFQLLRDYPAGLGMSALMRHSGIPKPAMTRLLARLVRWGIVELYFVQDQARYRLREDQRPELYLSPDDSRPFPKS